MGLLGALKSDEVIEDVETDSVGGNYAALPSGLYPMIITTAYVEKSSSGSLGLHLVLTDADGKELRNSVWMTGGDAKGNKKYYIDKQGNKKFLPGFLMADSLALLTVQKSIEDCTEEQLVIKKYDYTARAEVPATVAMLRELLGTQILVGVLLKTVDKTKLGDDKQYHPTGETREQNEIDKFFRASDNKTTSEIRAQAKIATFFETWKEKNEGKVIDDTTKVSGQAGAPVARATNSPASGAPTTSLFAT